MEIKRKRADTTSGGAVARYRYGRSGHSGKSLWEKCLERKCLWKRFLSGVLAWILAFSQVPLEGFAGPYASVNGFEVSLQWAGTSDGDTLVWKSVREEKKTITMQVNYRNNQGGVLAGFPAGGITIRVPGIGMANRTSVQVADAAVDNMGGEKTWTYTYEASTDTYVFRNTRAVDSETSFAGAFQIAWDLQSRETTHGYRQNIRATLEAGGQTVTTNELVFQFQSQTDSHTLEAQANALEGPDGLGEQADRYYWVRYAVKETIAQKARGTRDKYYTVTLPQGAVLWQAGSGDFESLGGSTYRFPYAAYQNVYVAYPKDRFGGTRVDQDFVLRGTYLDTDKDVILAQDRAGIIPSDYGFRYDGYLYWVGKGGAQSEGADAVRREELYKGKVLGYTLMAVARYGNSGVSQASLGLSEAGDSGYTKSSQTIQTTQGVSAGEKSRETDGVPRSRNAPSQTGASPSNLVPSLATGSDTDLISVDREGQASVTVSDQAPVSETDLRWDGEEETDLMSPNYLDQLPLTVLADREAFARAMEEARTLFEEAREAYEEEKRQKAEEEARRLALLLEAAEDDEPYVPDEELVNDLEEPVSLASPSQAEKSRKGLSRANGSDIDLSGMGDIKSGRLQESTSLGTPSQADFLPASPSQLSRKTFAALPVAADGRASAAMDLYLLDDFIDITGADGAFRQLGDEEYEMVDVTIPSYRSFTNANGFPVQSGKYTAEIVLGTNRKGTAAASFRIDESPHTYQFPAGTSRFLIRIRNVDESLYINQFDVDVNVAFHLNPNKPVMPDGIIRNNDGLVVELAGTHHNTVFDDSYLGSDAARVRQRDLSTYGTRIQRWCWDYHYESDLVYQDVYVGADAFTGSEEGYRTTATFRSEFRRAENLKGFSVYSLLPMGMEVDRKRLTETASFSGFQNAYGEAVGAAWLGGGFSIRIMDNYKGTGRTLVEGRYDYSDSPVSVDGYLAHAGFAVPVLVSFDALAEYGTAYVIQGEQIVNSPGKESTAFRTDKNGRDDGSAFHHVSWKDINGNGNTAEPLVYNSTSISVTRVMATQMELKKEVSTPQTGGRYRTNRKEDGSSQEIRAYFGHGYSYRLNLRNTGSPAERVVLYDILEEGQTTASQWKGTFQRVDVSQPQSLGLQPVVYYSTSRTPGTLDSGRWSTMLPSDKALVKAIAIDFGPGRMKTARDVYAEIFLMAPEPQESLVGKQTANGFSVSYTAADQETSLDSNEVRVNLDHPKGVMALKKVDAQSGEELAGYEFCLLEADGTVAATLTDQGMDPEEVRTGTYLLRETRAPEGYRKAEDQTVTIQTGLNSLVVRDPRIPGRVSLVKKDASDQTLTLEGAVFDLCQADGTRIREGLRTDGDGRLLIEDLEWGSYYLEEVEAPEGHYLYGSRKTEFTIQAAATSVSLEVTNRSLGKAELVKYDADQPELWVEGAEYELYNAQDRRLGTYRTDRNGRILAEGLEWGEYYFVEKTPAPGYLLNPSRIDFTIFQDNALEPVRLDTRDEEITAAVKLTKYDAADHSRKLASAVYSLQRRNGQDYMDLGTYKTDRSGELEITGLKFGEYVLEEITPPAGYVLTGDSRIPFTLNRETAGTCLTLEHENRRQKGSLEVYKTDEEQVPVAGAVFALYRDGELYLDRLVTDDYGMIRVGSLEEPVLEWGDYVLKETEAPRGYRLDDQEYAFTLDAGTVQVPVQIKARNQRETGSVRLVKYKKGDHNIRVAGAVYRLYDTTGRQLGEQTTGAAGEAVFTGIPWGAYYLQEASAPAPYVVSGEKLRFSVNRDNYDVVQVLEAEDEVKKTSLTITKELGAGDVHEAFGNPTFLYRIEGKDGTGTPHTWYRQITLGPGHLTDSVTLANIEASDGDGYRITELNAIRYCLERIRGTHIRDIRPGEQSVVADLCNYTEAEAVFTNRLEDWQKYSHTTSAVNLVKQSRQLTFLQVEYSGPQDVSGRFTDSQYAMGQDTGFLNQYLKVTAFYDVEDKNGKISKVLSPGQYVLEPGILEGQGTAAPYTYDIRVSYSEHGSTRSGNFQVTARVNKPLYTLTYHNPAGKNTAALQQSCRFGTISLLKPAPVAGYTFGGWYRYADYLGASYEAGASFTNTDQQEVSLYGRWLPVSYSISYSLGGGSISGQKSSYHIETDTFTLPTPTRNGYTFRGWTGSNGSTPQTTVQVKKGSTGNRSFTANWTPVEYTITYYLNGGTINGQRTTYNIETATFVLPAPVRASYSFTGWTGSNGGTPQKSVSIPKGSTGNKVYSAGWQGEYAELLRGSSFNAKVKELSCGAGSTVYTEDTAIKGIAIATSAPSGAKTVTVSSTYSPKPVTAYFDKTKGILYLVSTAKEIRLNEDTGEMFRNMKALTDISALSKLNITTMRKAHFMFCGTGLKSLAGFSGWDVSRVTAFDGMFSSCEGLTSLAGIEGWNTSGALYMNSFVSYCTNLTSIDALANWNVSSVQGMSRFFHECRGLKNLNALSRWNTSSVVNMSEMFYFCLGLTSASGINGWNIAKVNNFDRMFYACSVHPEFTKRAGTWSLGTFTPK